MLRLAVMTLLRTLRRRLSLALVLGLLLAQWAMASYVCPGATAVADTAAMSDMPGCAGMSPATMDPDQPQLCKAHCEQDAKGVNATPNAAPATAFNLLAVLDWRASASLPAHGHLPVGHFTTSALPPPGTPPIYLVLRVLRD